MKSEANHGKCFRIINKVGKIRLIATSFGIEKEALKYLENFENYEVNEI